MNYKKYISFLSHNTHGQLLIEILVAIALSSILLPALLTGIVSSRSGKAQQGQRVQAVALMKETEEAIRSIREREWDNFATNGTYHPSVTGTEWTLTPSAESVSGFTRSIVISDVYRDTNGVIVTAPSGTRDPSTKKVEIAITWTTPYASSVNSTMYITRFTNTTTLQTTEADFTTGITDDTFVTNTSGGEVVLGAGGGGNWCSPNLSINPLDLPKNGVANAISAIEGKVIAGTGENASGVAFANILVANSNPPTSQIDGTFDNYKTNGVFAETNYAYIATDNNSKEMVIIDLTNKDPITGKYAEVGYFNTPSSVTDALSVYVSGNIGFLTAGSTLYTINLSSNNVSKPMLASKALPANGTKVVVVGEYAYISIAGGAKELQIIRATNGGATLTNYGYADVNGEAANDVSVNSTGTRAYLATTASTTLPEFFIIDTTNKTSSNPRFSQIGSYNSAGMDPEGVAITTGNKAILVGTGGEEYQVIDITNETSPIRCGGLQLPNGVHGVASVLEADGDAYSYIITGDSSNELKIIAGGVGGQFSSSGTFTSSTFDASTSAAFNRIVPVFTQPNQTTVRFQVAVAAPVASSCSGALFSFVGPDGSTSTYFTGDGLIPLITAGSYQNPERCFKYKVFLDTADASQTPVFNSMLVNYSP